jgi:hypothetical protein
MNTDKAAALFADDMWGIEHTHLTDEEKAILTADYTPADRNEGADVVSSRTAFYAPQGRSEQGWRVQPAEAASAVSDIESEPGYEPVRGKEAAKVWAFLLAPGTVAIGIAAFYFLASYGGR